MRGRFISLSAITLLFLAGACGDGTDEEPTALPTTVAPAVSPSAEPTLLPPSPKAETDVAVQVVAGDKSYQPTVADLRALPQVNISGAGVTGVALESIAEKLDVREGATITVEGRSDDLARPRFFRGILNEHARTAVLVVDESGRVTLAGSSIPKEGWVYDVEGIGFE